MKRLFLSCLLLFGLVFWIMTSCGKGAPGPSPTASGENTGASTGLPAEETPGAGDSLPQSAAPVTSRAPETTIAPGTTAVPGTTEAPETTETPEAVIPDAADWMSALSDSLSLASLSIPGTHESCARFEPLAGSARCQTLSLSEQLEAGVRYLDIRCRRVDNSFSIYHGMVSQNMTFEDVLDACYAFLSSHPGETILMCVKEEYEPKGDNDAFDSVFKRYLAENPERWYTGASIPTLQEARGRIVLIRRFAASGLLGFPAADGWADNTTFTLNAGQAALRVQDYYNVTDGEAKWEAVTSFFARALPDGKTYFLNNTSGYQAGLFGIPKITAVSDHVNPLLLEYLSESDRFVGITAVDFMTDALARAIWERNFS